LKVAFLAESLVMYASLTFFLVMVAKKARTEIEGWVSIFVPVYRLYILHRPGRIRLFSCFYLTQLAGFIKSNLIPSPPHIYISKPLIWHHLVSNKLWSTIQNVTSYQ
jgi:uncharacterized RDD family membrane protein YckC